MSVKAAVAAFFCSHGGTPLFLYLSVNITIICIFSIPYFIYPLQCLFDFSPIFYVLVQMFSIFRALCHFACKGRYFFPGNFVKTALFSPFTGGEGVSLFSVPPGGRTAAPLSTGGLLTSVPPNGRGKRSRCRPAALLSPFPPGGERWPLCRPAVFSPLSHPTEGNSTPSAGLRPPLPLPARRGTAAPPPTGGLPISVPPNGGRQRSRCRPAPPLSPSRPTGDGRLSANWRSPHLCPTQRKGTAFPLPACGPSPPFCPAGNGSPSPTRTSFILSPRASPPPARTLSTAHKKGWGSRRSPALFSLFASSAGSTALRFPAF